jgi:putative sterol carrier protein
MENNIAQLVQKLPSAFMAQNAEGVNASIVFHVTGADGGDWTVDIKNKSCMVSTGAINSPTVVITASSKDLLEIFSGKLNGMQAYMTGRLKVKGNIGLATQLVNLFDKSKLR